MTGDFYAPRFSVRVAGLTLAADIAALVSSVSYESSTDVADGVTLALSDPDRRLIDLPLFDLGRAVELYLGYGDDLKPMMLGEIAAIEPSFPESGAPMVRISGYDRSYRLRHGQPDRPAFHHMTDSLIAA
jgi:phage protein D